MTYQFNDDEKSYLQGFIGIAKTANLLIQKFASDVAKKQGVDPEKNKVTYNLDKMTLEWEEEKESVIVTK